MPGMSRDDFNIDIDESNHRVILSGKRDWQDRQDHEPQFSGDSEVHEFRQSRSRFERQFTIPDNVKRSDIQTETRDDGTFAIIIPK